MPWISRSQPDLPDLSGLEARLGQTFSPISPDPRFVQRLGTRLTHPSEVTLEEPRRRYILAIILAAFGLFSGAFLFWLMRLISAWLNPEEEPAL